MQEVLLAIKNSVKSIDPKATIILFGSFARGENTKDSDIDILILTDNNHISIHDENAIKYPIYDLEFETGKIISPIVLSKSDWQLNHCITPFFANIKREGIEL